MSPLREQILAMADFEADTLFVPEWSTPVTVRSWTAAEREKWEKEFQLAVPDGRARALTVAMAARDAAGDLIFTLDDVPALGLKSGPAIARIFDAVLRLNSVTKTDVEELEGN